MMLTADSRTELAAELAREASISVEMPTAFQQDTTPVSSQQTFDAMPDAYPPVGETNGLGRYDRARSAPSIALESDVTYVKPEYTISELTRMAIVPKPSHNGSSSAVTEVAEYPELPESVRLSPELGAKASPWLDEYIRFSRTWAPRAYDGFHEGVGLWTLSTLAAGRVVLNFGKERVPSLYLALCARTSLYTKSTATEIGQDMLRELGLGWLLLPNSLTPQRFIHEMAGVVPDNFDQLPATEQDRIKTELGLSGKRGWHYEEFGEKLDAMMKQGGIMSDFRGHLRRLDDGLLSFTYGTISRGNERIEKPYLALLASLTPADVAPYAQPDGPLWHDGFFARFAFVSPSSTTKSSRARFPNQARVIPQTLLQPLKDWHLKLGIPPVNVTKGEKSGFEWSHIDVFQPTQCSLGPGVYDAFYRYSDALLDMVEKSHRTYLDGSYARFPEKALRVSMLLASLDNHSVIELRHWARAQEITERWRRDLHNLVGSLNERGPSKAEQEEDKVYRQFSKLCGKHGRCTARQVGQNIDSMDTATAERYLEALVRSGAAISEKTGKTTYYSLPTGSEA